MDVDGSRNSYHVVDILLRVQLLKSQIEAVVYDGNELLRQSDYVERVNVV